MPRPVLVPKTLYTIHLDILTIFITSKLLQKTVPSLLNTVKTIVLNFDYINTSYGFNSI